MAEYRFTVYDLDSQTTLESYGPYYTRSVAEYQAKKTSRFYSSPTVIVGGKVIGWFRMGRRYRP